LLLATDEVLELKFLRRSFFTGHEIKRSKNASPNNKAGETFVFRNE